MREDLIGIILCLGCAMGLVVICVGMLTDVGLTTLSFCAMIPMGIMFALVIAEAWLS